MTNKLSAEYDNIVAVIRQRERLAAELERVLMRLQAGQYADALSCLEGILLYPWNNISFFLNFFFIVFF